LSSALYNRSEEKEPDLERTGTGRPIRSPYTQKGAKLDKMLEYADLLHRFEDPDAKDVREFAEKYASDEVLTRRVQKMNALFLLKAASGLGEIAVSDESAKA
jgi:hypothetical protein